MNLRCFTELEAWKIANELKLFIYEVSSQFPENEKYNLVLQIRKAAVSVTANIAEGFGRFTYRDNLHFCIQARGSLFELYDHILTAFQLKYIDSGNFATFANLFENSKKSLNGYIRYLRSKTQK